MAKIFISYSRASKDVVEELVKDLADDDRETWFDQHLTGGQKWWDNILSEIRKCEIFVAALTPNFIESKACQREIKYAKDLQKILLPVRLSGTCRSLPPGLSELQWVDYSLRNVEAFKSLRRTLKNLPKAPPLPDPLPDAPAVPISYLSNLRTKIGSDSQLQLRDQIQLVFELRRQFRNGDPAKELIDLLQRLKNRDDLFAVVSPDIDHLIRDIGREFPIGDQLPPSEPKPPGLDEDDEKSILPPPKALLTLASFVIGAVILAAYFFLASSPDTVRSKDHENQASLAVPHVDPGRSVPASPAERAPTKAPTPFVKALQAVQPAVPDKASPAPTAKPSMAFPLPGDVAFMGTLTDINTASWEELRALKGIGDIRAANIIKNRPYWSKDELVQKNIIPPAVYAGIKDEITAIIAKQQ